MSKVLFDSLRDFVPVMLAANMTRISALYLLIPVRTLQKFIA